MAGNLTVSGTQTGGELVPAPAFRQLGPFEIPMGTSDDVIDLSLASGANTITVPTLPSPNGCIIIPPGSAGPTLTLKGVTGDTGVPMSNTYPTVLNWGAGNAPANFVITASTSYSTAALVVNFF